MDSLMSYDFTNLSREEILDQLHVVDDRRIWLIAEAIRKGISYEQIHDITKIDLWFIDKIAILTEMEHALETQPLTVDLLKEAKRIEFPDNVIANLTGKSEEEIKKMADMYKMEADKIKELLGDRELEQMKKDMAVQKAVTLVADEAKEA